MFECHIMSTLMPHLDYIYCIKQENQRQFNKRAGEIVTTPNMQEDNYVIR